MQRKVFFIVNRSARTGRGKSSWSKIKAVLKERGISYKAYETKYAGHAGKLAGKISGLAAQNIYNSPDSFHDKKENQNPGNDENYEFAYNVRKEIRDNGNAENCDFAYDDKIYLITVGGDGTFNEVINGIDDFSNLVLGILPVGSGNDFARGLGLDKDLVKNLNHMLDLIEEGSDGIPSDLGRVLADDMEKPRLFAISSGMGLDAIVCKKALSSAIKKFLNFLHLGKLTYLILTVQTLFSMKTVGAEIKFDSTDRDSSPDLKNGKIPNQDSYAEEDKNSDSDSYSSLTFSHLIFCAAMNLRAEGGGVPMAPGAVFDDGRLNMCMAHDVPKLLTFFLLPLLVIGKHEKLKAFDSVLCRKCEIRLSEPVTVHADGEYCGENKHIIFECLPGRMRVLR